jgi:hypothetical protein
LASHVIWQIGATCTATLASPHHVACTKISNLFFLSCLGLFFWGGFLLRPLPRRPSRLASRGTRSWLRPRVCGAEFWKKLRRANKKYPRSRIFWSPSFCLLCSLVVWYSSQKSLDFFFARLRHVKKDSLALDCKGMKISLRPALHGMCTTNAIIFQ